MDSYTLFGHVVDVAGIMTCQRAHIELQALGVLPEASLENNPPLKQEDADARAALALWCGLVHNPDLKFSSKQFFTQLGAGKGRAPMSAENDNFILDLAEVLRRGPEALGVESIFLSHVVTSGDGFNGRAMIEYSNGSIENYTVGQVYLATHMEGVVLDFKRLRALHEDLISTPRAWPHELSGIFNLVIEGLERVIRNKGFTKSAVIEAEGIEYKDTMDSVAAWIKDVQLIADESDQYHSKTLYEESYCRWCIDNDMTSMSRADWRKAMINEGFKPKKLTRGPHKSTAGWAVRLPLTVAQSSQF